MGQAAVAPPPPVYAPVSRKAERYENLLIYIVFRELMPGLVMAELELLAIISW